MIDIDAVIAIVNEVLSGARVTDASDSLVELGLDSLTILNVIVATAEGFSLDLGLLPEDADLPDTVGDLQVMMNRLQAISVQAQ